MGNRNRPCHFCDFQVVCMCVHGGVFSQKFATGENQDLNERYSLASILVEELLGIEWDLLYGLWV